MSSLAFLDFMCTCCGEYYKSAVLTSAATPGFTTTDFFTMAAGEQAIHRQVHTCPHCGFSSEEPEEGELREDVRRFVHDFITPQIQGGEEVPSWKKFEFLALIDENLGAGPYSLAMLYLQAAWCCYDLKQGECEEIYRKKAISFFLKEIGSGSMDDDLVYMVPYLLAEQYRRIGDEGEAARWYNWVTEMDVDHPDRDLFVTLADQQNLDPKEFMGEIMHEDQ